MGDRRSDRVGADAAMTVPSTWTLIVLALAAYRTWRLLAIDMILAGVRHRLFGQRRTGLFEFVLCPWCFGAWITIGWWAAWQAWPHATAVVAVPFAISLLVGLIARNLDP